MQVVVYDLPGLHGARDFRTRSTAMRVAAAWLHVQECDIHAIIVDSAKQLSKLASKSVDSIARALGSEDGPEGFQGNWARKPVIMLLNKIDLVANGERAKARDL